MVEVPAPTTVTVFPEMVATAVLLLVYVNGLVLLEVGGVSVNGAAPTACAGTVNVPTVGGCNVAGLQKNKLSTIKF